MAPTRGLLCVCVCVCAGPRWTGRPRALMNGTSPTPCKAKAMASNWWSRCTTRRAGGRAACQDGADAPCLVQALPWSAPALPRADVSFPNCTLMESCLLQLAHLPPAAAYAMRCFPVPLQRQHARHCFAAPVSGWRAMPPASGSTEGQHQGWGGRKGRGARRLMC